MNDWLIKSKNTFQDQIFNFLWSQWNALGIAGTGNSEENRIIDPESLLLFSLNLCRYEPRLFDEIIDWLFQNGQFINVQRLQRIQEKCEFKCGPQLSAVAELMSQNSSYRLKWAGLAKKYHQSPVEPLFFAKDGTPLPCPQDKDADPEFMKHGLRRGKIKLRGYSQGFNVETPACLVLRLRALIGINARAELLCLLAALPEIHPSEAARKTGFYQKTVQTALVDMAQSGAILTRVSKKEKFYRLRPGVLDSLLKPHGKEPVWEHWTVFFKIVETICIDMCRLTGQKLDDLLLISELIKTMKSMEEYFSYTDMEDMAISGNITADLFPELFRRQLRAIGKRLIP